MVTAAGASFVVVSIIVVAITVAFALYLGVGAGTVAPGYTQTSPALAVSIWKIGPWFVVAVSWSHTMWVVVMDVGIWG